MTARVEITKDTAGPALKRALAAMQGQGRELMLGQMGEYLVRSTRERAARQVDPDGDKWPALSPAYARRKAKKRPGVPMLKFDFHMLGDQFSHQVDSQGLLVGTNAPYGAAQHFGRGALPERRWLGLSRIDRTRLLEIADDHIGGKFSGD